VQLLVNERFLRRESRISKVLLGLTFLLLGIGMFLSLQAERWSETLESWGGQDVRTWGPVLFTYAIVLIGVTLMQVVNPRIRRYAPHHRQDNRLRQLLKGLDDRHTLYAFLGGGLPDYVLVGPSGVYVLTTKPQDGEIVCRNDRWSRKLNPLHGLFARLYGNPLGSPSYETGRGVKRVRDLLQRRLPDATEAPPITGLVVFTGDRVRLRVERCTVSATTGRELRKVIGRSKNRLSQVQLTELRAAFEAVRTT
jgi:hypothetical protein